VTSAASSTSTDGDVNDDAGLSDTLDSREERAAAAGASDAKERGGDSVALTRCFFFGQASESFGMLSGSSKMVSSKSAKRSAMSRWSHCGRVWLFVFARKLHVVAVKRSDA
jgi:hypothetical protein